MTFANVAHTHTHTCTHVSPLRPSTMSRRPMRPAQSAKTISGPSAIHKLLKKSKGICQLELLVVSCQFFVSLLLLLLLLLLFLLSPFDRHASNYLATVRVYHECVQISPSPSSKREKSIVRNVNYYLFLFTV